MGQTAGAGPSSASLFKSQPASCSAWTVVGFFPPPLWLYRSPLLMQLGNSLMAASGPVHVEKFLFLKKIKKNINAFSGV